MSCYKIICYILASLAFVDRAGAQDVSQIPIYERFRQNDYQMIFERLEVVRYDKNFVREFSSHNFKYNRTWTAVNMTLQMEFTMGNQLDLVIQSYRFASNEFRLFPTRLQINICRAINNNLAGAKDLAKCGNFRNCPFVKGKRYLMCNWAPAAQFLPPFFPDGTYLTEVQGVIQSKEIFVVHTYATVFRPIKIKNHKT